MAAGTHLPPLFFSEPKKGSARHFQAIVEWVERRDFWKLAERDSAVALPSDGIDPQMY